MKSQFTDVLKDAAAAENTIQFLKEEPAMLAKKTMCLTTQIKFVHDAVTGSLRQIKLKLATMETLRMTMDVLQTVNRKLAGLVKEDKIPLINVP